MKKGLILGMAIMMSIGGTASASGLDGAINIEQNKVVASSAHKIGQQKASYEEKLAAKAAEFGMTLEEFKAYLAERKEAMEEEFKAKAEANGMTVEEFKAYFAEKKTEKYEGKVAEKDGMTVKKEKISKVNQKEAMAEFKAKAEANGMTVEEFKAYLAEHKNEKYEEKLAAKAEENGMTLEEFKAYLAEHKNEKYEEKIAVRAEEIGMTVEEFKAYLAEHKKERDEELKAKYEAYGEYEAYEAK